MKQKEAAVSIKRQRKPAKRKKKTKLSERGIKGKN
jgi:hypothetical protein